MSRNRITEWKGGVIHFTGGPATIAPPSPRPAQATPTQAPRRYRFESDALRTQLEALELSDLHLAKALVDAELARRAGGSAATFNAIAARGLAQLSQKSPPG